MKTISQFWDQTESNDESARNAFYCGFAALLSLCISEALNDDPDGFSQYLLDRHQELLEFRKTLVESER